MLLPFDMVQVSDQVPPLVFVAQCLLLDSLHSLQDTFYIHTTNVDTIKEQDV